MPQTQSQPLQIVLQTEKDIFKKSFMQNKLYKCVQQKLQLVYNKMCRKRSYFECRFNCHILKAYFIQTDVQNRSGCWPIHCYFLLHCYYTVHCRVCTVGIFSSSLHVLLLVLRKTQQRMLRTWSSRRLRYRSANRTDGAMQSSAQTHQQPRRPAPPVRSDRSRLCQSRSDCQPCIHALGLRKRPVGAADERCDHCSTGPT